MSEAQTPTTVEQPPSKPPRSPVERMIVWGVILIGLGIAGYEARARFGYNWTLDTLQQKLKEVDESSEAVSQLTLDQAVSLASFSPSLSEEEKMSGVSKFRVMKWPSLAKKYELKLILDDDNVLLTVETSDPPEEPERPITPPAAGDELTDPAGAMPEGGGPGPFSDSPTVATPGAGGAGGPGGGQRGGGNRSLTGLLSNEAVVAELGLTDEQSEKISALTETIRAEGAGRRELFQKLGEASEDERKSLMEQLSAMQADIERKTIAGLSEILDEMQLTRLQQIDWQNQGPRALTSSIVMEKLGLSEEQKTKLTELSDQRNNEMRALGREASPEDRQALNEKFNTEFAGVLTAEQTTAWTELLGEKFDLPAPSGGGRPQRPE